MGSPPPQPATVGRYRILAEIGRGAMGRVYRAHDPHTDRTVALKVLDVEAGRSAEQAAAAHARFLREARAAGRLAHPGIVAVYDADVDPATGAPFLAMELVVGHSLAERLADRGLLPWSEAAPIAVAVAEALDHANARGVVHRDLKPANVLLADDGAVKVSDFGVAMLLDDSSTLTGTLRGTPSYMAPEQIRGEAVDGRSDLYSLGAVLYEMLTGEAPFQAESLVGVAHQAVHDDPRPPSFACPDLPLTLERIVLRAMAKIPAERFATGAEMAAALRAPGEPAPAPSSEATPVPAAASTASARPPGAAEPRRRPTGGALAFFTLATALAAALAVAVWLGRPWTEQASPATSPPAAALALPAAAAPESANDPEAPSESSAGETPDLAPAPPAVEPPALPPPRAASPPARATTRPPAAPLPQTAASVAASTPETLPTTAPAPEEPPPPDAEAATATIELHFVNRIRAGALEVWLDGARAWTTPLASPRNPLRRIGGEELIGFIAVPAGSRKIEVRIANAAESIDARAAVSADLAAGETRRLRVVLPPFRSQLRLKWEP